ncbi:MAG TPA: sigma-70 family RNA polymerase sigma factor [Verrucomicrobiae bacterium]
MVSTEPQNEAVTLGGGRFAATHWSVVLAAAGEDSQEAAAALETLCRQYWYPLYAFVCRLGHPPADAEDIVQSFFAELLEKRFLQHADPVRGRFRTFLLASLKHFMTKQWQRQRTIKRGGGVPAFPLDELGPEELYHRETAHALTPEQLYDRAWALRVLAHARNRLRDDYARRGQAERFRLLESFLPGETSELTCAEAGHQLGLSEGSVKAEVHRLKNRYRSFLRAAVMPTVARLEDVEAELRELTEVLSQ